MKAYCEGCPVKKTDFFSRLSESQVDRITCIMQLKRFGKGEVIFHDGNSSDRVFAIRAGLIKTCKIIDGGKEQILNIVNPGNFMGLESLFDDHYPFSAHAIMDSEVCFVRKDALFVLLRHNFDIVLEIMKILAKDLVGARNQIRDLGLKDARCRVASFLLSPPFYPNAEVREGTVMRIPITRQEISDLLGLTMETVSRALSRLHNEKVIRINRAEIELINVQQLRLLSA